MAGSSDSLSVYVQQLTSLIHQLSRPTQALSLQELQDNVSQQAVLCRNILMILNERYHEMWSSYFNKYVTDMIHFLSIEGNKEVSTLIAQLDSYEQALIQEQGGKNPSLKSQLFKPMLDIPSKVDKRSAVDFVKTYLKNEAMSFSSEEEQKRIVNALSRDGDRLAKIVNEYKEKSGVDFVALAKSVPVCRTSIF